MFMLLRTGCPQFVWGNFFVRESYVLIENSIGIAVACHWQVAEGTWISN
jgi:hypothetical protein